MTHATWKTVQPAPTLDELKKHHDRYGHDKRKDGFGKWHDKTYKTWNQASSDSLIEVAAFYLDSSEFLALLKHMELPKKIINEAKEALDDSADDDVREQGRHPERASVPGADGPEPAAVPETGARGRPARSRRTRSR